jgi:hypothetical protein
MAGRSASLRWRMAPLRCARVKGLVLAVVFLAAGVLIFGCRVPKGDEQRSSANERSPAGSAELVVATSRADAASRASSASSAHRTDGRSGTEITAPCVLHAGDSHRHRREVLGPKGKPGMVTSKAECSFNAECVWEQGKASQGDGNVGVDCVERRCTCTRTLLSRSAPATVFTFDLETACSTTDEAQRLLQERCMKGMKVDRR